MAEVTTGDRVDGLVAVVLAAGSGTRLAPLTRLRPKALCPVGDRPLVDLAIDRARAAAAAVAVNVHHGRSLLEPHLADRGDVHVSVEVRQSLGTAGALGLLAPWIDGRAVLVTNADAWLPPDLDVAGFVRGWDGERIRLLCVPDAGRPDFGSLRYCGVALHPWASLAGLAAEPSGLYERCWRAADEAGRLDLVVHHGPFVDCGTPADYLAANLTWSGGGPVVGAGAVVEPGARLVRSVVWPGARVRATEELVDGVRADGLTVLVRART